MLPVVLHQRYDIKVGLSNHNCFKHHKSIEYY